MLLCMMPGQPTLRSEILQELQELTSPDGEYGHFKGPYPSQSSFSG